MSSRAVPSRARQRGSEIVEFALVAVVFLTLLFGLIEMGLILALWNSATEATRLGARQAVVCNLDDADIKAKMQKLLPLLKADDIAITYAPAGCDANSCLLVTVSVQPSATVSSFVPFVPFTFTVPPFSTTLPRESMQSTIGGVANPVCQP
jgi:Flp pilus assembly protein TadG